MKSQVSGRQLRAAIAAAVLAAGCGDDRQLTAVGDCTDPVLRVSLFSGDAGAPDGGDAGAAGAFPPDGAVPLEVCEVHCPARAPHKYNWATVLTRCLPVTTDAGAQVECRYRLVCPGGRASEGDVSVVPADSSSGAILAAMASLEGASVPAFEHLARELKAHGAPASLRRAARRAVGDERRHARAMTSLAQRYGARSTKPVRARHRVRDLEALARENAVEGCVRETWGALVASWQAQRAGDARVREVMAAIARDETAHAALAWRVARWSEARLTPDARARVTGARRAAVEALHDEALRGASNEASAREIGWPRPEEAVTMLAVLRARVWDSARRDQR